ncbi:MAG: NAD(P)/FAD-dependent oxidoreductase [Anaerohalosphaera sp.]|nr:NAD(P)/FAD-dependent oxidoreductase [Anaerohalosphaera sp.]
MRFDVCVVGGGAGGLMAAIFAARVEGVRVAIVERNTSAGRKLLKTGGSRCNVTHLCSVDEFVKACGKCGRYLKHCLYEFGPDAMVRFLAEGGVGTVVEEDGCVFPASDKSSDVNDLLVNTCKSEGAKFLYDKRVDEISRTADGFCVRMGEREVDCGAVVIATGGMSWPGTGSTGDGYSLAKKFGHRIIKPKASVVPLVVAEDWVRQLRGISLDKVVISGKVGEKKFSRTGAMIFTGTGIGGPASFETSMYVTDALAEGKGPVRVFVDLLPACGAEELERIIVDECGLNPKKDIVSVLTKWFVRSLATKLCEQADVDDVPASQLSRLKRKGLVKLIKAASLTITATRPVAEATVTRGGVCRDEIDGKTMESKKCAGLYFAGEVIDTDGPCGGYNLQIAWSTGAVAGRCAAEKIVIF